MTVAICIRCGERKVGAFTPCAGCSYDPAADSDRRNQAKALWLSDHHLPLADLEVIGAQIKARESVGWDARVLDELVIQLQTQQNALHIGKTPVGCSIFAWGLIAIVLALGGVVIFLVTHRE